MCVRQALHLEEFVTEADTVRRTDCDTVLHAVSVADAVSDGLELLDVMLDALNVSEATRPKGVQSPPSAA